MKNIWKYGVIVVIFAAVLIVLSGRKTEEEKLFQSAISKVDKGGTFLRYSNQTELVSAWQSLCDRLTALGVVSPAKRERIRTALRVLRIPRIRATAASVKTDRNGNYRLRQAVLLSSLVNPDNRNIRYRSIQTIPENTIFSAGGKINADWCWMLFSRLATESGSARLQFFRNEVPKIFTALCKQDFDAFLKSLKGEYWLTVFGDVPQNVHAVLILPDVDGKLAQLFAEQLKLENYLPDKDEINGYEPVIRTKPGKIIFASSDAALAQLRDYPRRKHFSGIPGWEKLARDLPVSGVFYFMAKFDHSWNANLPKEWGTFLPNRSYHLIGNLRREYDAYTGFTVTDLPVPKMMNIAETAFLLMPLFAEGCSNPFSPVEADEEKEK